MHVTILGCGGSLRQYTEITKRIGGRLAFCDQVWAINALGNVFDADLVFHMDDVRVQEIRSRAMPESNIAHMTAWLRRFKGRVITSIAHPDYPCLEAFPLAEVLSKWPASYFNSTAAYAVAYALHVGATKLTLFGCDYTYPDAHHAEKGRACVEFWLGIAAASGVELAMPKTTSLMDAIEPQERRFYGYDCVELDFKRDQSGVQVKMTERETLPTAEQIEHEYDHNRHPNPIVDAEQRAVNRAPENRALAGAPENKGG